MLRNQTDGARFSLLLDALCLDAAHRVKAASEASVVRQGAASLEAQAEAQGDATWCKAAVADIEGRLASGHIEAAGALLGSLEAERDRRDRAQAALARREAVLAKAGGDLAVEKAVSAGAQPLKVVADEWRDEDDLEDPRAMNAR